MNNIFIIKVFESLQDEVYCIIKLSGEFPDFIPGSDIDIFCFNINRVKNKILAILNKYIDNKYYVKVTNKPNDEHFYIDIIYDKKIYLRYDIWGKLPEYNNINVKSALFESIVEHREVKQVVNQERKFEIYIPAAIDEMIIRYIEYHEWYAMRPDKLKHIDYINNQLGQFFSRKKFFDKVHYYTGLPELSNKSDAQGFSMRTKFINYFKLINFYYKIMKNKSFKEIIVGIKNHILRFVK